MATISRERIRAALRSGTLAGLAMIPFGAMFRAQGLRINEYGRKTLLVLVGEVASPLQHLLTFVQHMVISWVAAIPLLMMLDGLRSPRHRVAAGVAYGTMFYVAVNAFALPLAFGDPKPWQLGMETVYPSLVVHMVFGLVVALVAPLPRKSA